MRPIVAALAFLLCASAQAQVVGPGNASIFQPGGGGGGGGGGSTIPYRTVSGATDTPTAIDNFGLIDYTSASAVAVTITDLGAGKSYTIHQVGAGVLTLTGSGATLRYQGSTVASLTSAYAGAAITVICNGNGTVDLKGNA